MLQAGVPESAETGVAPPDLGAGAGVRLDKPPCLPRGASRRSAAPLRQGVELALHCSDLFLEVLQVASLFGSLLAGWRSLG